MNELQLKIQDLEYTVAELKKELRRIKTTINKVEKLGLSIPSELLFKKEDCLEQMRVKYPETSVGEYRRLTTLIFRQLLKNYEVNTIKANVMGGAVGGWQFFSPQWWGID